MSLKDLARPEPWMDQEERQTAATLIAAFQQHFADRDIPENPFLTLRLQDCLLHYTLCRRLENAILADSREITAAEAAHIGKARERLRKALKDLEDTAKRLTPPAEPFPNSAETGNRSTKRHPESPKSPETPAPATSKADTLPQNENPAVSPPLPPIGPISPIRPIGPIPLPTPPPNPIHPAEHPRPTPQPVIHVPRPVPLAHQQQRR